MIEVLEVDQWTSTGDVKSHDWDALKERGGIELVTGGDSAAARVIFGGHFWFREVDETLERPFIGRVWFKKGADGKPELYRTNYDSSD